ncbi:AfsR/SARP family transcriptional regulator [Streptomyces sp. NRRL S-337]|uniref:AfsR/SARP family transcriptional regulator n=1 Tax=Streptomyces sp. NRRL S-337 TaxID=1463900 RepID=UPI0018FF04BA|nr:AfsR/SARP family transcriptional regulator [Streptomyces sp. NRRL S-337]
MALHILNGDNMDTGEVSVGLLGPLQVAHRGKSYGVGPNRARALLAVLALSAQEVVSIDFLIDELLTDRPWKNPKNALQAGVHRLRDALERITGTPGTLMVRTSANGYLLDVPPSRVDAHRFDTLAAQGAALLPHAPDEAVTVLEKALALWRGDALLDVLGGLRCQNQMSRLASQRLSTLEDLYEAKLVGGGYRVVNGLEQLALEHPERERLTELLMVALYRSGRQQEALATFQRVRSWLQDELGVEPGRKLRSLQRAILTQDVAIDARLPQTSAS